MTLKTTFAATLLAIGLFGPVIAQESPSPAGAKVYFINLKDGDTVSNPVVVKFGLSGMGIAPAGLQGDATAGTGHHHLLIDTELKGDALKDVIPMDDKHRHFGKGQTEATITLPLGTHTLQLVLADWTHVPHVPPVMSEQIKITVK
ncbi:MAG: DUF4399 domain-containing protein [Methylocystis sp.]|nr:DUF4399 domain-containing protein [Methylocystis sp.]MCA3585876.1 DUF4399 domain-containing protein [Methylocystis sp.]MCA3586614.1 DUF4399 domain-containing protein [Methylocystis sp.]MCA3590892.1 DUF4399 domain-containing protein [Methylocystis sp.]